MEGLRTACFLTGVVVVFGFLASTGASIRCYQCNSAYDPSCGDPFQPFSLADVDCSARPRLPHIHNVEATMCRKITQTVSGKSRVVRGCGYLNETSHRKCYQRIGTHDVNLQFCACMGELCNAATPLQPVLGMTVLVLVATTFL